MDQMISPYVITIFFAWVISHSIKYVTDYQNRKKMSLRGHLFISGGMPSGHAASVASMLTIIGLKDGINSGLFGLAALMSVIIMYDAVKVRRSSGEQGIALKQLIKEQKSKVSYPRVAMGHSPAEVLFGAILGVVIGAIVFLATK